MGGGGKVMGGGEPEWCLSQGGGPQNLRPPPKMGSKPPKCRPKTCLKLPKLSPK